VRLVREVDAAGDPIADGRLQPSRLVAVEHLGRHACGGGVLAGVRECGLGLVHVEDAAPLEAGGEALARQPGVQLQAGD